jgi:hypothetical protein
MPTNALATISGQPDSSSSEIVRQRLIRLAELIRKDGAPYPLTPTLVNLWVEAFRRTQISADRIGAAFDKAEQQLKFWPSPAEVLALVSAANSKARDEQAALKFDVVRANIRLHYSPDLPWRGPGISERTRRAINAAGGMACLSECIGTDLVFARQRFIEAYMRWDELKQAEYLLPDGEGKNLIADVADRKALPGSQETYEEMRERGLRYAEQVRSSPAGDPDTKQAFRRVAPAPSMRSIEEQKRILLEKGFLPAVKPFEVNHGAL